MTDIPEDIQKAATEAIPSDMLLPTLADVEKLRRGIEQAIAAERERCARIAEAEASPQSLAEGDWGNEGQETAQHIAAAIRKGAAHE